jgi:hypothetical protein
MVGYQARRSEVFWLPGRRADGTASSKRERDAMIKPIVLAMVVCDYYYRDVHTGKSVLAGTFNSINSPAFPAKHGNCAIYLAMTDVANDGRLQLEFKKEDGSFAMKLPPWQVKRPESRRSVVEIGGNINGLPLPSEGEYEFVVLWDDLEVFSRRMRAVKVEMGAPPQAPGDATTPDGDAPGGWMGPGDLDR